MYARIATHQGASSAESDWCVEVVFKFMNELNVTVT